MNFINVAVDVIKLINFLSFGNTLSNTVILLLFFLFRYLEIIL